LRLLVAGIATTDDGAVELQLLDGAVVRLGAADQLAAKLVSAETVLTQVDTTCLATVDVRVPSAPTVTRQPGCG
jgi:cell division septal protein FtsQ